MHFGQTLEAHSLPEWKSQYIDFRYGKKLISKLEQSLSSEQAHHELAAAHAPNGMQAALAPSLSHPRRGELNEHSPLLQGRAYIYQPAQNDIRSSLRPCQSPCNTNDETYEAERLKAKDQFFTWLTSEVNKSSGFYSLELTEAEKKRDVLHAQFEQFELHREVHEQVKRERTGKRKHRSFFSKLDLPSLPVIFSNSRWAKQLLWRPRGRISREDAHTSDFNNRDDHVGFHQAKHMLQESMLNYYHYLVQLREFRQLNMTAVRKIVKKFDKQLHQHTLAKFTEDNKGISLASCKRLDAIISSVEQMYADEFTRGSHKLAMDELRAQFLQEQRPRNGEVMFSSLMFGASVPLMVLGLRAAGERIHESRQETIFLLQMFSVAAQLAIMFLGFGTCLMFWSKYRINYPFVLDLDPATKLDHRQFWVLPSMFVFGLALFVYSTFTEFTSDYHRYYPGVFMGLSIIVLLFPTRKILQGPTRWWLAHSTWRVMCSGLYPVEFRDLMLGNLLCSLTYSVSNLELIGCLYSTPHWWSGEGSRHAQRCTSANSRLLGFLSCLPGIWRFLQCMRRYTDTLDWFPHLLNAGKYSLNILFNMMLSVARINPVSLPIRVVFVVVATSNSLLAGAWDILMDFSLVPGPQPREVMVYPRWSYWGVTVLDLVLRFNWILFLIFWNQPRNGPAVAFVVGCIEAVRRVIWLGFRVENEHAANIARCRAFKELTLPYDDSPQNLATEDEEMAFPTAGQTVMNVPEMARLLDSPAYRAQFPSVHTRPRSSSVQTPSEPLRINVLRRNSMGTSGPKLAFSPLLSPRVKYAHTTDFQRRQTTLQEEYEDEEEEEEEED